MTKTKLAILCTALLAIPSPASAADRLTEQSIQDFYNTSKTIHKKSFEEYSAYMDAHTTDDARIVLNDEAVMAGAEPQKQTITMDKTKFMASLSENYQNSQGTTMDYKIQNIKIAPDGLSATVKDTTQISGVMTAPGSDARFNVSSRGSCEDTIVLSPNGAIQTRQSVCDSKSSIVQQ